MIGAQLSATSPAGDVAACRPPRLAGSRLAASAFLSREERQALEDAAAPARTVAANTDLLQEGAHADDLFIIVEGWACRYVTAKDGGRQLSALLLPGDVGNLDSLLFSRLDYGVRTLTEATVVAVPRDWILALAVQHPGIARTFIWLALLENVILTKWTQSLGRRSAKSRLAHLLCELSMRLDAETDGESRFTLPMTQEQIADVLGLTAVHVNRVLQELRLEGMVSTKYRRMILPDVVRLRQSCGSDPHYLHMEQPAATPRGMVARALS
ncbi:Crp/Fnr family transcriptional regulator [Croceibacterium ferulae]|uniref:Crp/Fnr family transcriptional regulator n=1 Tax=Croceibacterium ferulae TaxID=1854641 RepID=UPI000EAC8D69|nr:Crp/Fnr family transcriptional regulator [Croceibacterium ferulae]